MNVSSGGVVSVLVSYPVATDEPTRNIAAFQPIVTDVEFIVVVCDAAMVAPVVGYAEGLGIVSSNQEPPE